MQKRRQSSIDAILLAQGEVKQILADMKEKVESLNERVGIQNGKMSKMEQWQSFIRGALSILIPVVTLIGIPVVLEIFRRWLDSGGMH